MSRAGKIFRNNVVVGLVLLAPLMITAFIVHFLIRLVAQNALTRALTDIISALLPQVVVEGTGRFVLSQLIALLLVLLGLFFLGFFVRSFLGRRLYGLAEKVLIRIPVFNKIYLQIRHISETIFAQRETMFNEVVLVEYPRKGLHSIGFVTSSVPPHFNASFPAEAGTKTDRVALFIPTTPNPTSGILIFAPRADVTPLSITVADAMQLVISAGAVYPGDSEVDDRPTLLDKLEAWITRETDLEPVTPPHQPKP